MWGNKNKVFRNWSERDLGPELKKQFSNQIESCGIYNPHFSPKKISTDQTVFFFFFLSTVQIHPAVSHWSSFLLAPTLCPAVQTNIYRKGLFFKADTAGCLQNGLFSAYFSKLKIMCYIAISLVLQDCISYPSVLLVMTGGWDASRPVRGISWKTALKELI